MKTMEQKEKIEPGKYFEIEYKLFRVNPDGTETLVHEVTADEPDRAIQGLTLGFVEALDEELAGKTQGDTFDFVAAPEKAFGPYTEEEIYDVPKDRLTVDGKFDEEMFTPGAMIPLMTPDGYRIDGQVISVGPDSVKLDLNHPLAKDKVHYVGKVLQVRDPKPEELQPAHSCGCGGCGCHDHEDQGECGCDHDHGCCGDHNHDGCGCNH